MVEAVIWLVIWLILAFAGTWLCVALIGLAGVGMAAAFDAIWIAPAAVVFGWLVGVAWFIFAAVHVVLQVVVVVQLAAAA